MEVWRRYSEWDLVKGLQNKVKEDFGILVENQKCWYAMPRAKVILYRDAADQYKREYDYANTVRKHNPIISALVKVLSTIERPIFQSMFICLKPVSDGFLAGCRLIIEMDECHLTRAYPGICLTTVGKDSNNNIYPLAWTVVYVEDFQTWSWLLTNPKECLGTEAGKGLYIHD